MLYQMVELEEGAEVQYLGVYALKWQSEWGPPSVGFVEKNVFDLRITYICAHCGGFAEVPFLAVEVFDSGTVLTCNRCGKDTVFDLSTPKERADSFAEIERLRRITSIDTCCAYCGAAYPEGTPRFGGNALTEHIKVCSEHPMRQAEERIKALEVRVREERAWAQYREDMYVAVRKLLRRAKVIKPHEEITVEDAVERLLRQIPVRTFDIGEP